MSTPVVIVNRRAGGGLSDEKWARLAVGINDGLGPFTPLFTEFSGHAAELAAQAALQGCPLVVAFGGDGTINEVANGILQARPGVPMGIIPRGTGGDFRRTLDLANDVEKAARQLRDGTVRHVDAGRMKLVGSQGQAVERYFVNVASFGFSAAVADRANRSSKRLGAKAAFLGATVRTLFGTDNADVHITVDDQEPVRRKVMMGAFGNGKYFGGGMKICPEADLTSGTLNLVTVGDLSRTAVILKTNRIYDGTHLEMPEVVSHHIQRAHVEPSDPEDVILVELDGETPGRLPASCEVIPRALALKV